MNSYLDKGFFLLILFGIYYVILNGKPPAYDVLFGGALAMVVVGVIIEFYRNKNG